MTDDFAGLAAAAAMTAEIDQWTAALRMALDRSAGTEELATVMAQVISDRHPEVAGMGRALVTAAHVALAARDRLERLDGEPVTADMLGNLIAITGLVLAGQEEASRG